MLITYAKGGARALDNIFYIARDLSALAPMQVVVGDQHIFDWWVIHNGREIRPQCYLWLDMRTRLVYGIAFEPGAYSHRTVARALKMGILRFGRFNSTYNDNGSPEKSGKIDHLVDTLQSYGMSFQDDAEMYRTGGGDYAIEDEAGKVVATAASAAEWRRQNRRMYALVKNAKAKPIERFFRTLEVLLQDMCLPGYVRDIRASAAEDEEAARRLDWQRRNGFLLGYEEFIDKVKQAIVLYENRDHAGLGRPPLEELRYAREREGWEPSHIDENDVRYIFLEAENRIVKGNRVTIAGRNYEGPALTRDMVIENRNNLAGLSGKKVKIYYDPDDPDAGAWAIDPRDGQSIFLTPEKKLNPFNTGGLAAAIERKRGDMKAVSGTFRETAAVAGRALTSPEYKPLIEARAQTTKVIEEKTAAAASMSEEDFRSAIASRIIREEEAAPGRQTVYAAPRKRYQAILDTILKGENLSKEDMVFKVDYESRMGPIEKTRWDVYLKFNKGV
jgi:putative transposase